MRYGKEEGMGKGKKQHQGKESVAHQFQDLMDLGIWWTLY